MTTDFEIVVYATHDKGMYNSLINNDFKIPITVLGFGKKWINYIQKQRAVLNYLKTIKDEDKVIIVLDAFDTKIEKHPQEAVKKFLATPHHFDKVVFSADCSPCTYLEEILFRFEYASTCNDEKIYINPGMYIGRVQHIITILDILLKNVHNETDDQKMINKQCKNIKHLIDIDRDFTYFENVNHIRQFHHKTSNAVFISFPGLGGSQTIYSYNCLQRIIRFMKERLWLLFKIISVFAYISISLYILSIYLTKS